LYWLQAAGEISTRGTDQAVELERLMQSSSGVSQDEDIQLSPKVYPVAEMNTTVF